MTVLVREPEAEVSDDPVDLLRARLFVPFGFVEELNRLVDGVPFGKQFHKLLNRALVAATPICRDVGLDPFLDSAQVGLRPSVVIADDQIQKMSNIVIAPGEERLNYPCQRLARTLGGDYTSDCCFGVIEPKSGKCAVNLLLIGNRKARDATQTPEDLQHIPSREILVGFE